MSELIIRRMERGDWNEVAELIFHSLNDWYRIHRGIDPFVQTKESMSVFPRVYEALDPESCVLAVDSVTNRIAASSFFHPRPTHISLGILNVHPDFWGRRAGGAVLKEIIRIADEAQLPLRLVSSALNFESFNLYNRNGFVPTIFFQDMIVEVPNGGFPVNPPKGTELVDAAPADIPEMVALEKRLYSIDREKDFRFFIENREGIWGMSLLRETAAGRLVGFCASVCDPGSNMVGPGIAETEEGAAALIRRELNRYPGRKPVWLIPSGAKTLRREMFEIGAKNCELHIGQVRGTFTPASGIVLPSFMPETS